MSYNRDIDNRMWKMSGNKDRSNKIIGKTSEQMDGRIKVVRAVNKIGEMREQNPIKCNINE